MDLLPFDLETFRKEPERLRCFTHISFAAPEWAEVSHGFVIAKWCDLMPKAYDEINWTRDLALAPKVRTVKVRLYQGHGTIRAVTSDQDPDLDSRALYPWVSDIFEMEISE